MVPPSMDPALMSLSGVFPSVLCLVCLADFVAKLRRGCAICTGTCVHTYVMQAMMSTSAT